MTFYEGLILAILGINTWVLAEVSSDIDMIKHKLKIEEAPL
jgi:hypothetical protein